MTYTATSSADGAAALQQRTTDAAVSTLAPTAAEYSADPDLLAFPISCGLIAVVYNLPGATYPLRLTQEVSVYWRPLR